MPDSEVAGDSQHALSSVAGDSPNPIRRRPIARLPHESGPLQTFAIVVGNGHWGEFERRFGDGAPGWPDVQPNELLVVGLALAACHLVRFEGAVNEAHLFMHEILRRRCRCRVFGHVGYRVCTVAQLVEPVAVSSTHATQC